MKTLSAYRLAGNGCYRERFGLDFEDFAPGQRFRHRPGITFSQDENVNESLDTHNGAMLHYDAHYASQTTWRRPLMVSTLTLQRAIGMASKTFGRRKTIARFDEIAMSGPVFGGDTLYAESEILGVDGSTDPETGALAVETRVVKPDHTEVARLRYHVPVYRRGCGPADAQGERADEARFASHFEDEDGFLVEQAGLFFDDFAAGETFIHWPRHSFSWGQAVQRSRRALNMLPQTHDLAWIDEHRGGTREIPEADVIGTATALTTRTFGRVAANLGWYDVTLHRPALDGDTVEARSEIVETRVSRSRQNEGIVTVDTRLFNQHQDIVLSFRRKLLVYLRAARPLYGEAGY